MGSAPQSVIGEEIPFSDVGNVQTIHRARLVGLSAGTTYSYTVGSGLGNETSQSYNFTTAPESDWFPTIAVYGDMGITPNAEATMPWLLADAAAGKLDIVVHIGDVAYDLSSNNGKTGDAWMVQMQPLFSHLPYETCPGNHEDANDFYEYRMRLGAGMPLADSPSRGGNGTFHSFNSGLIHFALVSSEVYMSVQPHSAGLAIEQAEWLERDLARVNRTQTPFVALGLHQPFYCSPNDDSDDCHQVLSIVRIGLEKIIYEGGVDIVFGAHEHSYERNYPVYQSSWNGVTGPDAYVNPASTVHILTGAAGCPENQDGWKANGNPWSAVRINDYGYGRLRALNRTALYWEYVDNVKGNVMDSVTIVKTQDGPGFPRQ
jgi:hypothetical protein